MAQQWITGENSFVLLTLSLLADWEAEVKADHALHVANCETLGKCPHSFRMTKWNYTRKHADKYAKKWSN